MRATFALMISAALCTVLALSQGQHGGPFQAGSYTTLSGFYDYQSNGGACQYVAVNPNNGHIHVIYMTSFDSTALDASRRTQYAYSSDDGATWNNFSNVRIPYRQSGFPSLTLKRRAGGFCPAVATQALSDTASCGEVYVDSPEGSGTFSMFIGMSTNICLKWPHLACTTDSALMFVGSGNVEEFLGTYVNRLGSPQVWKKMTNDITSRYAIATSQASRVGVLLSLPETGVQLYESTDNGRTWLGLPRAIYPPQRVVGTDTFQVSVGFDLAYFNDSPVAVFHEYMVNAGAPTDSCRILFWSQATGLVVAADKLNTPGVVPRLNRSQVNHLTMGYPVIAVVGSRIVVVYQAFMSDTSAAGFNYGDLFYTQSVDMGNSWFPPSNLTQTPDLDERYPSISKQYCLAMPSFAYVVWQEDPEPGSAAVGDNAPLSRASLKFARVQLYPPGIVQDQPVPVRFALDQNHPNPFNPSTTISFTVPQSSLVTVKVFDLLGRAVATLVNEKKEPGTYEVTWDAAAMSSGVYFCQLTAGPWRAARKLVLSK